MAEPDLALPQCAPATLMQTAPISGLLGLHLHQDNNAQIGLHGDFDELSNDFHLGFCDNAESINMRPSTPIQTLYGNGEPDFFQNPSWTFDLDSFCPNRDSGVAPLDTLHQHDLPDTVPLRTSDIRYQFAPSPSPSLPVLGDSNILAVEIGQDDQDHTPSIWTGDNHANPELPAPADFGPGYGRLPSFDALDSGHSPNDKAMASYDNHFRSIWTTSAGSQFNPDVNRTSSHLDAVPSLSTPNDYAPAISDFDQITDFGVSASAPEQSQPYFVLPQYYNDSGYDSHAATATVSGGSRWIPDDFSNDVWEESNGRPQWLQDDSSDLGVALKGGQTQLLSDNYLDSVSSRPIGGRVRVPQNHDDFSSRPWGGRPGWLPEEYDGFGTPGLVDRHRWTSDTYDNTSTLLNKGSQWVPRQYSNFSSGLLDGMPTWLPQQSDSVAFADLRPSGSMPSFTNLALPGPSPAFHPPYPAGLLNPTPSMHPARSTRCLPRLQAGMAFSRTPATLAIPPVTVPNTQPNENFPPDWSQQDRLLVTYRRQGLPYKKIKLLCGMTEQESTLRGRFRNLTKAKVDRVRKPKWSDRDVSLLENVVSHFLGKTPEYQRLTSLQEYSNFSERRVVDLVNRVPWKKVATEMKKLGCYQYGNATVKKKYIEVMNRSRPAVNPEDDDQGQDEEDGVDEFDSW